MTLTQAAVLGLVQGLTEFLPVSSSGHLVLAREFLDMPETTAPIFEIMLHLGTLASVFVLMWRDVVPCVRALPVLARPAKWQASFREDDGFRAVVAVAVSTIPVVIVGILWRHRIEAAFGSPSLVALLLSVTATMLLLTRFAPANDGRGWSSVTLPRALFVGVAQVVALMPGISRSGTTMSAALAARIDRPIAGSFAFLMSIPAVAGAVVLSAFDDAPTTFSTGVLLTGIATSFLSGTAALWLVLRMIRGGRLWWFSPYLYAVTILWFVLRR